MAGILPIHYFFQDLHIAQRIFENNPVKHVDIGSRIEGFVAHIASFREIEILDIRPMDIVIPNVKFRQCDIMQPNEDMNEYADSLSCLHALEHFGLGRYGDPIDYDGYLKGFNNINRILKQGGKFYFSVPMGKQRTEFHAHRVFSLKYLLDLIQPLYKIDAFAYIDDENNFFPNIEITLDNINNNCNCKYGCAVFELTKK
jgi:SAM-dependent methyltransferase